MTALNTNYAEAANIVSGYKGTNPFLSSVAAQFTARGRMSDAQVVAVLNVFDMIVGFAPIVTEPVVAPVVALDVNPVADGYFTVVLMDDTYVTLRVKTAKSKKYQNVAYLSGPQNTSDYTTIGGLYPNGEFRMWKNEFGKLPKAGSYARQEAALGVLQNEGTDAQRTAGLAYAMQSGNCYRCGRLLTTPNSITLGIGPVCRAI